MRLPNPKLEKELQTGGYEIIVGLDEVGRGCWAGPVAAGAIIYDPLLSKIKGINDSKLLTAKQREKIYQLIENNFDFSVGVVASQVIDACGIVGAIKLAMEQAVAGLKSVPQYLLIDALRLESLNHLHQRSIIRGDQKVLTIAAASIMAKVTRDRLMDYYHLVYDCYGFDCHKGYGTARHSAAIRTHGICPLHRRSFAPISSALKA